MNTVQQLLSQTVPTSGFGVILLALIVGIGIPFVIARPPTKPAPNETTPDQIHRHTSNFLWYIIFAACLIVALSMIGEIIGIDTLSTITPR